jgi:uncharacterized phage infection (PIP) family protein YhgE
MLMLLLFLLAVTSSASVLWLASVSFMWAFAAVPLVAAALATLFFSRIQSALADQLFGSFDSSQPEQPVESWAKYAHALPTLTAELKDSAVQLNQAIGTVCHRLRAIENQAVANVAGTVKLLKAADADHADRERQITVLVRNSRRTLRDGLDRIVQSSGRALRAAYELEDVKLAMSRVSQLTDDIEQAGWGMSNDFSEMASRVSCAMHELLRRIDARFLSIYDELRQIASTDFDSIIETHDQLEKAVAALTSENDDLRVTAECTAEQETSLARNVADAMREIEAEDAANRALAHLEQALVAVERDMHHFIAGCKISAPAGGE